MGKNIIITRENIVLKNRFYDLVIPKQPAISFSVHDCRSLSGLPIFLQIKAEKQKVVSRFFVGRLVYAWHKFLSSFLSPVSRWHYLPNFIYFEKNIMSFLYELAANDYEVEAVLAKMAKLAAVGPSLSGCHWQKELRKIMALALVPGLAILIYSCFVCQRLTQLEFVLGAIVFLFICFAVYALLSQVRKNKKH